MPQTEEELNQAIASGALEVLLEQQRRGQSGPQVTAPAEESFDRDRRRSELSASLLERSNAQRAERGAAPLLVLPAELSVMIEARLDEEQAVFRQTGPASDSSGSLPAAGPGALPGTARSPGITGSGYGSGFPTPSGSGRNSSTAGSLAYAPAEFAGFPDSGPAMHPAEGSTTGAAVRETDVRSEPAVLSTYPDTEMPTGAVAADLSDEQVARLYERIKTRLRRELLVDRERSGHLMDFR
jgi:hypothetical protein